MKSSSLIRHILRELDKSRKLVFSKKELLAISPDGFQELSRKSILKHKRPSEKSLERVRLPRCHHGCGLTVVPINEGFEAICLCHPEEDPIPIEKDALNRYAFSFDAFLIQIRLANGISGQIQEIDKNSFYLGFKCFNNFRVGLIFLWGRFTEKHMLSGLKLLCKDDSILILLTPTSKFDDIFLKRTFQLERIIQISLIETINPETFELPIDNLVSRFLESDAISKISQKQKWDYENLKYLSFDKVHIPSIYLGHNRNEIIINGKEVILGNSGFLLFLRLTVELKKGKGGWIDRRILAEEKIIPHPEAYQAFDNLRSRLKGWISDNDIKKFIQNNGEKQYRISTHPAFITYDKKRLLNHPDNRIRDLVKKLL